MAEDILTEVAKSKGDIAEDIILALEQAKKMYPDVFASELAKKSLARKIDKISGKQSVDTFNEEINNTAQNLNNVLNDNLGQKLKSSLKNLSGTIINNFEKNFEAIALTPNIRNRIASSLDGITTTSGIMTTLNKTAREIDETINDNLFMLLKQRLGSSNAVVEQNNFINNYPNIALDTSKRQLLFNQLFESGNEDHLHTISNFRNLVEKLQISESDLELPDEKLCKYLQPLIGTAQAIEVVKYLEEANPELINNEELKDKFIKEVNKVPDEEKNHMIAAAIKLSTIRSKMAQTDDNFEFKGAYANFENITTRLLKNLYNAARYTDEVIINQPENIQHIFDVINSPLNTARILVLNDTILNKEFSQTAAQENMHTLKNSANGCSIDEFKTLIEYIAEKSGDAAEIMFNTKEFRNFSQWGKERAIEKAKQQALTGKQETPDLTNIRTGNQNGY